MLGRTAVAVWFVGGVLVACDPVPPDSEPSSGPPASERKAPAAAAAQVPSEAKQAASDPAADGDDDDSTTGCDERHAQRCFDLARALPAGSDVRELAGLLETACTGGVPQACYSLSAVLRRGGAGVPADPDRAQELVEKACREGSQIACDSLGH